MKSSLKSISFIFTAILLLNPVHGKDVEEIFRDLSEIEEPFELRDPFQPIKLKTREESTASTPLKEGVFTNVPLIGQTELDQITITGVLIGPERRAFVKLKGNDSDTYTIKEGTVLGMNGAEVKAILPGGIILVEKVTNIYGEVEYLETVIPISK